MAYTNGASPAKSARAATGARIAEKAMRDGKIDWDHVDAEIERQGTKIILPNDPTAMPIPAAIQALERRMAAEEEVVSVNEVIDAYPLDGAVAFMHALKQRYGWANPIPTPGFFGPEPPEMLTVDVGPNPEDKIQVPWGRFVIPGIEHPVDTGVVRTEFGPAFTLSGSIRKKEAHVLKELADLTRSIVAQHSIYRGKAIRLRTDESGDLNPKVPPQFIATAHVKPDELVLPAKVKALVETNIFTLIKRTDDCLRHGIPLKRGVLLEGPYGTGKTMTATVTFKHAVDNGWTAIMLDRCQGLRQALEFAKRYQPAVVFAEDVDRATADRTRESTNDLLNILDGMLSKDSRIMVVLTTNHVDKINPAMLRPGRLDAVISVTPPDASAVQGLVRLYARSTLESGVSLDRIGEVLAGSIPAVIREVVERSKLAMIGRGANKISEEDLIVSADGIKAHAELLKRPEQTKKGPIDRLADDLAEIIGGVVYAGSEKTETQVRSTGTKVVSEMGGALAEMGRRISSGLGGIQSMASDAATRAKAVKVDTELLRKAAGV